ncbi:hypothetical protein EVAR_7658_1 [Eumeta japonica]|uniref:Mariner Mos1 transposase n=1 Tax=Eumeta variegata TaxID=151549 RepID=A0A4C1TJG8_EUMVA|nr:hypothetical protein EVAR_7658_1 [Eumeta japonica]
MKLYLADRCYCITEFKRSCTNLTDDVPEERSSTATTDNITAVRLMIETAKRMTYQQIRTSLGINMGQLHKIFYKYLPVVKLCTRWIPYNFTNAQKLWRINWCREMM